MNSLLVLFFLLTVVHTAFSIHCYSCDEAFHSNCAATNILKLEQFKLDCDQAGGLIPGPKKNRCAVRVQNGQIERLCHYDRKLTDGRQCQSAGGVTACVCNGDYCNYGGAT